MNDTRKILEKLGLPKGDDFGLPSSSKRFDDGAQYRFEVPGIQGPTAMKALLEEVDKRDLVIHRVTQTKGIMLLTDSEISQMVGLSTEFELDLVLAVGPRATYDTSASVNTVEGQRMGYRLRGQEQVVRAVEDIKRGIELGCSSFLLYDEGLLWVLNEMKKANELSNNIKFKISAHMGHGNPASVRLLQNIGASSINPVRDLQLPMLSAIRQAIEVPIDLHTENPKSSGGFIRHYEVPEMIRLTAPLYLKTGGSVAKTHAWDTTTADAKNRARQVSLVKRVIDQYYPEAIMSPRGSIK